MAESPEMFPLLDGAPEDILSYVHDMLKALAALAAREGDDELAGRIRIAASGARRRPARQH